MDEWSEYIKKEEVAAGTLLGKNLAFEVEATEEMKAKAQAKKVPRADTQGLPSVTRCCQQIRVMTVWLAR